MKAKHALAVLSVMFCLPAQAGEQDFYGIQMRNDLWAWNLVLHAGPRADDADLLAGPVIDHKIYGEALVRPLGDRTEFLLSVVNNGTERIRADYHSRDFMLYLEDGKIVPLIDPPTQAEIYEVRPRKSATFAPSLGNMRVRPDQVRMIEASFDLGRTRIFLFPASMKKEINALTNPDKLVVAPAKERKKEKPRNFWEWMSGKPKSSKVPSADPSGASTRDRVDRAIHDFKYKPAPVEMPQGPRSSAITRKEQAIDAILVAPPEDRAVSVRTAAQVVEVNRQYNYVTVNVGLRDGLERDMLLNIVRGGRLVARVRVRQIREDVAAALILPEYKHSEIRPGDLVNLG